MARRNLYSITGVKRVKGMFCRLTGTPTELSRQICPSGAFH